MNRDEKISVLLMLLLIAFSVVLVEERLLRTAMTLLPALMLAQLALGLNRQDPERTGAAAVPAASPDDRRHDEEVRSYIEQLLKHFREFYTTCHLMSVNVLTIEAAEERANNLEKDLNKLLAKITETARRRAVEGAVVEGAGGKAATNAAAAVGR